MKWFKCLGLAGAMALLALWGDTAQGNTLARRQYYGRWTYYPARSYYYSYYYYKPVETAIDYEYHYTIYYPSRPRYVYYYNPHRRVYWGRYDLQGKGDKVYSLLDEKDRKQNLSDIPEKAFPTPGAMPTIPTAKDKEQILPPPSVADLKEK